MNFLSVLLTLKSCKIMEVSQTVVIIYIGRHALEMKPTVGPMLSRCEQLPAPPPEQRGSQLGLFLFPTSCSSGMCDLAQFGCLLRGNRLSVNGGASKGRSHFHCHYLSHYSVIMDYLLVKPH